MNAAEGATWEEKAARLKKLVAASQALAKVESVDELLPILLLMAQDVTLASASSFMLYDEKKKSLSFSLAMNEDHENVEETLRDKVRLKLGEGVAGWVAQHREKVRVDDAAADSRVFRPADAATGFVTRNLMCVPVLHGRTLLGVAQVLNAKGREHFDDDDMELLESFAHLASVALIRGNLLEAKLREQRMRSQLEAAARIQQHFWPKNPCLGDAWEIWGRTRPAVSVGGDMYDFIAQADGSWIICIADVAGKGLPAAMVMAALWGKSRGLAAPGKSARQMMAELNNEVLEVMGGEVFATAVIGRLLPETGELDLALAGHLPPLLKGPDGVTEVGGLTGLPLGIDEDAEYSGLTMTLEPGQSLVLVTDGVTEARNKAGEFYGDARLLDFLRAAPAPKLGEALLGEIRRFRGRAAANDDTTVVVVRRKGTE